MGQRKRAINEILKNDVVRTEFIEFFLGKKLGSGCYRHVFDDPLASDIVIKIDVGDTNSNVEEFSVWNDIKDCEEIAKWFAPCVMMSRCGRILMQKKCKPIDISKIPEYIPSFFTDVKPDNFGLYKGRVVCMDYGNNLFRRTGMKIRLVKSKNKMKWLEK